MANEEDDRTHMSTCSSEGVEYRLHDIVKIFDKDFAVPHIGKILKMWEERSTGTRKALVSWFLWHKEVKPQDADNPKELFLAVGKDKGATNELNMDSILGKCKVVCISKDSRNKEPSANDIENADFVFSSAYDVDLKSIVPVDTVADKLGPDVVFNTEEWLIAIAKIKGKPDEFKPKQSMRSPLSESKKRPRDAGADPNLLKKKTPKLDDVKKGHVTSEEIIKKKKVLVLDGKVPVPKKAREGSDSKQEASQIKKQPLKTETVSKITKLQPTSTKEPAVNEEVKLDKDKSTTPKKPMSDTVNVSEQTGKTQKIIKNHVRQVEDKTVLWEKSKDEGPKDERPSKLDIRSKNSFKEEKTQPEGRESGDRTQDGENSDPKDTLLDSDFSWREDPNRESMLKLFKNSKSLFGADSEKRLTSAAEMIQPFERSRFFKELPWGEILQHGVPQGKVLHLQNIDPLVNSADMREMLRSALPGLSDARMLPKETSAPSGQAVAIFESRQLAESALEAITADCLVMAEKKWPLIASKVEEPVTQSKFPGHLALEKMKLGRNLVAEDYKKAVSTSHCSQPNTIEFEMAMEWRQLQEVALNSRMELFKKQKRELNDLRTHGSNKGQK